MNHTTNIDILRGLKDSRLLDLLREDYFISLAKRDIGKDKGTYDYWTNKIQELGFEIRALDESLRAYREITHIKRKMNTLQTIEEVTTGRIVK